MVTPTELAEELPPQRGLGPHTPAQQPTRVPTTTTTTKEHDMTEIEDDQPEELEPWNPEWLVRRGNYLTEISPELARQLLEERNVNNRRPRKRKIAQFAREMQAGRWDPDASDIKFARDGELIDGQTRLMACVEAGVPFPVMVRTCVRKSAKSKIDTGSARTAADALKMSGVGGSPTAVAAAVTLRHRHEERMASFDRTRGREANLGTALTHDEILEWLAAHPMTEKFASRAERVSLTVFPAIPRSVTIAAFGWFAEQDEADAARFVEKLRNGEWGGPGDPLVALVSYAARLRGGRKSGSPGAQGRALQEESLMALIKTWNAYRMDEPIKLLSIRKDERLEEPV